MAVLRVNPKDPAKFDAVEGDVVVATGQLEIEVVLGAQRMGSIQFVVDPPDWMEIDGQLSSTLARRGAQS